MKHHCRQFQKLNAIAEHRGWAQFVSMQNLYNLTYREEEREMIPYCLDAGIGMIPWSPLAAGQLTGRKRSSTTRSSSKINMKMFPSTQQKSNEIIIDRLEELANKYNATCAQIALAWEYTKNVVAAPIVGISKIEQLYDLIGSLDIKLTDEDVKYIEEPYTVRAVIL
jgi:aryl-alcohol dehydrogenase-like predicted oxidoreductase